MQISKWAWFIIGNAALGLFTCYLSVILWVTNSLEDTSPFSSIQTGLAFLIGLVIFVIWNYFMLKKYKSKYWLHSLTTFIGTILLFFLMFQFV